ncbi:sulfatase-like hydrolase/transferase [uncultured Pelagimonas sp.]|uniref:sulfatase-like hydrolase/transferase n=1 Tax=uncultured Pelagimonas sp. TaxID=1618102 RepID=UPI00345A5334
MTDRPNVLWIMADQLRFDYLSCFGHPHLQTPHIDALAQRGIKFTKTYVQSPVCGPSRMSADTGRYVRSHGSTWNGMPLRVGEPPLRDHLREAGAKAVLVGKTHMIADRDGMAAEKLTPACECPGRAFRDGLYDEPCNGIHGRRDAGRCAMDVPTELY